MLKNLCDADMNMISGHKETITSTLFSTLLRSVPPPHETDLQDGESPQRILDAEVSTFVGAYIQLVNLSYCDVPLLSGYPPSAFVPKYNVFGEVTQQKGCVYRGDPIMNKSVKRIQIKLRGKGLLVLEKSLLRNLALRIVYCFFMGDPLLAFCGSNEEITTKQLGTSLYHESCA